MSTLCDDLRAAILQAAMQGKLTEQLPEDGDAEELLAKIISKKEALIESGSIRRQPVTKKILKDDAPFTIPDSWKWVRVGDLGLLESGFSFKSSDYGERGIQVVRISDLGEDEILTKNAVYYPDDPSLAKYEIKKYSILICLTGSIGKMALVTDDRKRYLNQRVGMYSLYEKSILNFLWRILHAENIKFDWISHKTSTNGNIKNEVVLDTLVPLPPVAEQKRIVEKIDELMARVADLEQSADALASLKKAFPDDIKASLLQAAMQGKLTEQLPGDGNAEELLDQIKAEKEKLISEGKIKKQKPLAPITDEEIPFSIPENWTWVRLGEIGDWGSGATPPKTKPEYYRDGNIKWLLTGDLNNGLITDTTGRITELALEKTSVRLNPIGSVLIAMYGATIGKLGILDVEATTNQACCACMPYSGIYNWYLFYFLMQHKSAFISEGAGAAQPNISKEKIIATIMPLPPLAEQRRIVERVNILMQNINVVGEFIAQE